MTTSSENGNQRPEKKLIYFQVGPIQYRIIYQFSNDASNQVKIDFCVADIQATDLIHEEWRRFSPFGFGYNLCKDSRYTFRTLATLRSATLDILRRYQIRTILLYFPNSRHQSFWLKYLNYVAPGCERRIQDNQDLGGDSQVWVVEIPEEVISGVEGY
jgi:hypothetical protein